MDTKYRLTKEEYADIKSWLTSDEGAIEWYLQCGTPEEIEAMEKEFDPKLVAKVRHKLSWDYVI